MNLSISIGDVKFKNPVFTGSGTFGYGEEYAGVFDINKLGGIITKGLTLQEQQGNAGLRIQEVPCGIINRIGLQNVGVKNFIQEKIPFLNNLKTKIIINIAGFSIQEFLNIIEYLDKHDIICGYEINVSCTNVKKGGIEISSDEELFTKLLKELRSKTDKLLIVKLSPSAGSIADIARIAEENNINAIPIANTYKSALIDIEEKELKIKGGLSGPAIFPITLNMVLEIYKSVNIPIIASGGISDTDTAIQYLLAGATAVQVGTYNFIDPLICLKIIDGIKDYLKKNEIDDINKIIGIVKL